MSPQEQNPDKADAAAAAPDEQARIVVVTQDGMGVAGHDGSPDEAASERPVERTTELVEQPAKVMRIGSMIKQLLEEVRSAGLDEQGRKRLADIHARSIAELKQGLAPELSDELDRIVLPFGDEAPSDAELRIAQAQLVGWLEGLFHGIQTAIVAQQMASQAQLQATRRGLPQRAEQPSTPDDQQPGGTGQYL